MHERLIFVRKNNNLSRKALSELIDVPQRTIENYEKGERKPSIEYLEKINHQFGVDFTWLITGQGEPFADQQPNTAVSNDELQQLRTENANLKKSIQILASGHDIPRTTDSDLEDVRKLREEVNALKSRLDSKGLGTAGV